MYKDYCWSKVAKTNIIKWIARQMILNLVFMFLLFPAYGLHTCFGLYIFIRRYIMAIVVLSCCLLSEDGFDRDIILFNSRVCVCECLIGYNSPWSPLLSANVFVYIYIYIKTKEKRYIYIYIYIYIYTYIYIYHHHHHVAPPARISLTVSRHFSLSFIASGRSSGLHPVSSHSCCM